MTESRNHSILEHSEPFKSKILGLHDHSVQQRTYSWNIGDGFRIWVSTNQSEREIEKEFAKHYQSNLKVNFYNNKRQKLVNEKTREDGELQ